jgi:hypothetical protein
MVVFISIMQINNEILYNFTNFIDITTLQT